MKTTSKERRRPRKTAKAATAEKPQTATAKPTTADPPPAATPEPAEKPPATAATEPEPTTAKPETAATEPEAVDLRAYRHDKTHYIHLGTGATPGNFAAIFAPSRLF